MAGQEQVEFDPPITGGVVVGYDGSPASSTALTWALEEARLRALPLHAVRAWKLSTAIAETGVPFGTVPSLAECEEAVTQSLDKALGELDEPDEGGVTVARHVVHGSGAHVLLAAGEVADLLVVGRRGAGGFSGLRIGSVAEQVARHARCTVVVVR